MPPEDSLAQVDPEAPALRGDTPDGRAMARLAANFFRFQKGFAGFLGVGESTVAGWLKAGQVPDPAKRAAVLAGRHWSALKAARDGGDPRPRLRSGQAAAEERAQAASFPLDLPGEGA